MSFEPGAYDLAGLAPGQVVTVRGAARTSFDGAVFDAATHTDATGSHVGGLYALDGTGLRVTARDGDAHAVTLVATGDDAPVCRSAGMAGPCLLPRTSALAHERLMTVEELEQTLTGSVEISVPEPPPPIVSHRAARGLALAAALLAVVVAIVAWRRAREARRATAIGRVMEAAREARRRTRGDATLATVGVTIDELVARASVVERERRSCARRLGAVDRAAVARRRSAWAAWAASGAAGAPGARAASESMAAEEREVERLAAAHDAALASLEEIAASLRAASLRTSVASDAPAAREAMRAAAARLDEELALREDAAAEVERAVSRA